LGEGAGPLGGQQPQPSGGGPDRHAGEEDEGVTDGDPDDDRGQRQRPEQDRDEVGGWAVHVGLQVSGGKGDDEIDGAAGQHPPRALVAELVGDEEHEVWAVVLPKPPGVEADGPAVQPECRGGSAHAGAPPGRWLAVRRTRPWSRVNSSMAVSRPVGVSW
jgi:hypothetical protein